MNTVKRGAGRPAAAAKTSKHAQRTPLPPRREIEEPVVHLPGKACDLGQTHEGACVVAPAAPSTSGRKRAGKSPSVESPVSEATPAPVPSVMTENAPQTKSWAKACAFRDAVSALGWSTSVGHPQDGAEIDLVECTAQRGDEYLYISWVAGALQHPVTYTIDTRTVKMRNASQAKQYAARSPEEAAKELTKVVSNKAFRRKEVEPKRSRLPFDPGLATNEEVVTALIGKTVAWHNRISQGIETATLGRDAKRIRVEEKDGGRQVLFCCPSSGFRAFRLADLVQVGGGKRYVTRTRDGQRVEREELPEEVTP